MSGLQALLLQQPAAFWLGAGGLLLAAGVAGGWRTAVRGAAAGPLAAVVALLAPRATPVQAAVFALAIAAAFGLALRHTLAARGRARAPAGSLRTVAAATPSAASLSTVSGEAVDARLLGRVVRAAGGFHGEAGEVEVDGLARAAVLAEPGPAPADGDRLRVVRVGGAALAVRPLLT